MKLKKQSILGQLGHAFDIFEKSLTINKRFKILSKFYFWKINNKSNIYF
jgi:hypothetical protein